MRGAAGTVLRGAGAVAIAAVGLVHTRAWAFICDDAYISFRFARNLAEHGTLAFNVVAPRELIEGYTNVLWVLLLAQAAAFYVLATRAGAPQPYMALKMCYLLLWPMAACAVMALGELWLPVARLLGDSRPRLAAAVATAVVLATLGLVVRPLVQAPARLHPLPPAVSLPLYDAGRWARTHVPAGCVEYLVGDDETAYWLHLAVLGNPRMSDRTGNNATYEPNDAVMRWLTPNGLPYAIADLPSLPRDVREELDVIQPFGTAAVVRRRGPSACDAAR